MMKIIALVVLAVAACAQAVEVDPVDECASRLGDKFQVEEMKLVSLNVNKFVNLVMAENPQYRGNYITGYVDVSISKDSIEKKIGLDKVSQDCSSLLSIQNRMDILKSVSQCMTLSIAQSEELMEKLAEMPAAMRVIRASNLCSKLLAL